MGNEGEGLAAQAAAGQGGQRVARRRRAGGRRGGGGRLALPQDAVVVGGAGGLDLERSLAAALEQPAQHPLVLQRVDLAVGQLPRPAGGHQQERVEGGRAQLHRPVQDRLQLAGVEAGHGGVDLELQPRLAGQGGRPQHRREGAPHPPEGVVGGLVRPVQAQADAADPRLLHPADGRCIHQQAAGGHGHGQAQPGAGAGQGIDVLPDHGFPAGEDDDRAGEGGDALQQGQALGGGQLPRVVAVGGRGAAVAAGEGAAAGDLPGQEAQDGGRRGGAGNGTAHGVPPVPGLSPRSRRAASRA